MKVYKRHRKLIWKPIVTILALLTLSIGIALLNTSCSTITSSIIGGAESGLSTAISESVEQSVYKKAAPKEKLPPPQTPGWNQYMISQAYVVFSYSFSMGGYWFGTEDYKVGEWTRFQVVTDDGDKIIIEKAFLKKLDNGNEWWRVSLKDSDGEWIYEALLSPDDGKLLRLRGKDADGNVGEIPVTEDTVYGKTQKLTKESIEGATVGKEKVKTPAGSFNADHVVYNSMGNGKIEFWLTDKVPGRVVKYSIKGQGEGSSFTAVLIDYGKGAKSILKSF